MTGGRSPFRTARGIAVLVAGLALSASGSSSAQLGGESCSYDAATKTVTAAVLPGGEGTLRVAADGSIEFGAVPTACGDATATNTDGVRVTGSAGSNERLVLDQSAAFFGPGVEIEYNIPEIELDVALGDSTDTLVIVGTPGDDVIAPGQNGVAIDSDGDLDVTLSPGNLAIEIRALAGDDLVNGRGQGGAGLAYLGPLALYGDDGADELVGSFRADRLYGGPGNDSLHSNQEGDLVYGEAGDDWISASEGNDTLVGGPGADALNGGYGDDLIDADDDAADTQIHGGPDVDTAYYDAGIDPATIAVENRSGDSVPPPPPPPPGPGCVYDPALRSVTAGMPDSGEATLAVVGTEIRFGASPARCGDATTANTDSITVIGKAGAVERLVVDQTAGRLAPGATPEENGASEIELVVDLGGADDYVLVHGAPDGDVLAAGTKGVALNGDVDVDLTYGSSPSPAALELAGGGGNDVVTGRGSYGTGQAFAGSLVLRGGDLDDVIHGSSADDVIVGGAGDDEANGGPGGDELSGDAGNDALAGSDGADTIVGGTGSDSLLGGYGDDVLDAFDAETDSLVHGGPGTDSATYDAGLDPSPVAVENRSPR